MEEKEAVRQTMALVFTAQTIIIALGLTLLRSVYSNFVDRCRQFNLDPNLLFWKTFPRPSARSFWIMSIFSIWTLAASVVASTWGIMTTAGIIFNIDPSSWLALLIAGGLTIRTAEVTAYFGAMFFAIGLFLTGLSVFFITDKLDDSIG